MRKIRQMKKPVMKAAMNDDSNSEFSLNKTDDEASLRDSLLNELTDATAFDMNSQNAVNNDNKLPAEEIAGGNKHPLQYVDLVDCNKEEDGISCTEGAVRRNTNDLDGNVYGNIDGNCYEEVLAVIDGKCQRSIGCHRWEWYGCPVLTTTGHPLEYLTCCGFMPYYPDFQK